MVNRTNKGRHEKSPKLKNRAYSGPDSLPQAKGIENIPPDNVVRLGLVRELLGLSDSRTFLVRAFLVRTFLVAP